MFFPVSKHGSTSSPSGTGRVFRPLQVVEEVMCHDTPFAQRRVVQDVFMSKWVDWPGKNGDFWFSSEIQKKVPNVHGIFIYTSTNLPADVKPFMDWAQLYFKCKKNNTFGADLYIDCFCLEILKASHLGIFNHQLDDPQPEFNSGWTMTVG